MCVLLFIVGLISIGRRSFWLVVIRSLLIIDIDRVMCEEVNKLFVNKLCFSLYSYLVFGEREKMGRG